MKSPRSVFRSRMSLQRVRIHISRDFDQGFTNVKRAISCGVCSRIETLSKGTSFDTVATGFWLVARYSGPMHCAGADGFESPWGISTAGRQKAVGRGQEISGPGSVVYAPSSGQLVSVGSAP